MIISSRMQEAGMSSATRVVASTLGVLVGLAGIEHGFLEVLQGHVRPQGMMIDAIGPSQRIWEHAAETALTVVPSFFVTGILAMIVGLVLVIWAAKFVHTRFGPGILLLLSIILFLVGGGFAPILLSLLAFAAATRIGKPLGWWRSHLPTSVRWLLTKLWPWSLIAAVLSFVIAVEIAIFGYPLLWFFGADATYAIQWALGYAMLALTLLSLPTAFAFDIQRQIELDP
jgi:hypothetical protein